MQMEVPRRLVLWMLKVRLPTKIWTVREENQVKDQLISSGHAASKVKANGRKRRKPDQRPKNKAPALNHLLAPNSRMQGIFRLSLSPASHSCSTNLTFDASTAPNSVLSACKSFTALPQKYSFSKSGTCDFKSHILRLRQNKTIRNSSLQSGPFEALVACLSLHMPTTHSPFLARFLVSLDPVPSAHHSSPPVIK